MDFIYNKLAFPREFNININFYIYLYGLINLANKFFKFAIMLD